MKKHYISSAQLLRDSVELALQILRSDYKPDFIAGVWRGGTPVAIAVQEALEFAGMNCDHISIRTSSYTGIGERSRVSVYGLEYLEHTLKAGDSLLLVDDVFDTGMSIEQIIRELHKRCLNNLPDIKIAMPYYKPLANLTSRMPDFYLHAVNDWLVFPHELAGLNDDELLQNKGDIADLLPGLLKLRKPASE